MSVEKEKIKTLKDLKIFVCKIFRNEFITNPLGARTLTAKLLWVSTFLVILNKFFGSNENALLTLIALKTVFRHTSKSLANIIDGSFFGRFQEPILNRFIYLLIFTNTIALYGKLLVNFTKYKLENLTKTRNE